MVPSLATRTKQPTQHRPDVSPSVDDSCSGSSSSQPRVVLKRFTLHHKADSSSIISSSISDGGHHSSMSGLKRNAKSSPRMDEEQHATNASGGGGIWKNFSSALTHPHQHHEQCHPWALRFKEEGLPHYLHGKCLQGHSVLYIKLHKNRLPDLMKTGCNMEQVEAYFHLLLDFLSHRGASSSGNGGGAGFVAVVDMKHSKMKHLTGEETTQALKKLEKLCRSPPQMIQRVFMIHAPLWLTSAWPGLKVLVPDAIPIHVVNSTKSHKKLLKYIAQEELPAEFGGKEDSHLGQHGSDVELHTLLTKLQGGGGDMAVTVATTPAEPRIEVNPSDATRGGDESSSSRASSSTGGVAASARNRLTVSLRFHREDEEKHDSAAPQEGVETVVKSPTNKPKRFMLPKLCQRRSTGSNSSKTTSSDKSSFSSLDGVHRRNLSMDESEESSGVVEQNGEVVETAGIISSDDDNYQDVSIWQPLYKWWSPDKASSCPAHKTTVYYSAALENVEPMVPIPLVGVVPPRPQTKASRRKQGLPRRQRHQEQGQRKFVFGRGKRSSEPSQ